MRVEDDDEGTYVRKLPPKRKLGKALAFGSLIYRKWLFAKQQETHLDSDARALGMLSFIFSVEFWCCASWLSCISGQCEKQSFTTANTRMFR